MKISTSREFGEAIRNRRKTLGYTQGYISEVTGFSTSFISDLENGKPTIEFGKALYLVQMLGMDLNIAIRG